MAYKQWQMMLLSLCLASASAGTCPDDPDLDLCDDHTPPAAGTCDKACVLGCPESSAACSAARATPSPTVTMTPTPTPTPSSPTPTPTPASPTPASPSPSPSDTSSEASSAVRQTGGASQPLMMVLMALAMGKSGLGGALFSLPLMLVGVEAGGEAMTAASTCGALKTMYKESGCCGEPTKVSHLQVVAMPPTNLITAANPCVGTKPVDGPAAGDGYFKNTNCTNSDETLNVLEQSGTDVTKGYKGQIDAMSRPPISTSYWLQGMCPVNVHWHLGAEHRSEGQYDENGKGPAEGNHSHRRLAEGKVRLGFRCLTYDETDVKFTKEYHWQYCKDMKVGETYEVHWPHSAAGACATPFQYQTPFYDGVFCNSGIISLDPLNTYQKIGVQGQVFTIVNDEKYYYPDLIRGMIVDGAMGTDVSYYTGSTTGTSRNNEVCSRYTPITWQVDRKCHLISASSFDKMCADMLTQRDDMSGDVHPHGARELVLDKYAANNHQRL